jgi:TonB-linked SusC/RagA family outer membrane protein
MPQVFDGWRQTAITKLTQMYKIYTKNFGVANRLYDKILLIMRLTTVILIASLVQVSAATFGQRITLNQQNIPLKTALREITRQSGYGFYYDGKVIGDDQKVGINISDAEIGDALKSVLAGLDLTYSIDGKIVSIKKKEEPSFLDKIVARFQEINVWGRVIDENGNLLPGATVKYRDKITRTDFRGEFILKDVTPNELLEVSYIGYVTLQIKAQAVMGNIVLKLSDSKLDEVQVIAYGQTTKRFNVGSVSTLTAKDLERQPVSNVLDALQGQVPGLSITTTGGVPGSRTLAQVRGQNNLGNTPDRVVNTYDQPLLIVDGVPMPLQNNALIGSSFANGGGNSYWSTQTGLSSINGINPLDIESISILKDADATSIYGSQGSNGVILITTKRGKAGKEALSFALNQGFTNPSTTIPMMNTEQYLSMRKEALANSKVTPGLGSDPDLLLFDQNKYTNWMKSFFGGTAHRTDLHFNLSGGSFTDNYLISGGYTRTTYNFPGDMADKRYNLHTSFTHQSNDQRFKLQLGTDYSYNINNNSGTPSALIGFTLTPNFPDLLDATGKPIWSYKGFQYAGYQGNPLATLVRSAVNGTHSLNTHINMTYEILPKLTLGILGGYARMSEDFNTKVPISSQNPLYGPVGNVNYQSRNTDIINIVPQLNFTQPIGKGTLTVLVGGTYKRNYGKDMSALGFGYTSDALLDYLGAAQSTSITNSANYYKYIDVFSRINFRYADKYIINLTANRDGSSNFGPRKRYGNFGSAGAAWIVSEEKWLKNLSFLSFLKLSANVGTSGSDGVAPYQYQPNWRVSSSTPYQTFPGYTPLNPFNPEYAWASNRKFHEQVDLGFFKDRLLLSFTLYQNRAANQLVSYIQPIQTGFNSITTNAPYVVKNSGLEFSIASTNINTKEFRWVTNLNMSRNNNNLASFPNIESSPYASYYVVGKSLNARQLIPYERVNPQTGLFEFRKADGTLTSSPNNTSGFNKVGGDRTVLLDINPKLQGGLGNTFTYKNISLNLFFQYSIQKGNNYLNNIYANSVTSIPGTPLVNLPADILGRQWQKPGDEATLQRFADGFNGADGYMVWNAGNAFAVSTGSFSDASYIRLKTTSLAYSLPTKWMKKAFLKNCSININAQNLFLISGYELGDPETMSLFAIPPQKTVVMGINASF